MRARCLRSALCGVVLVAAACDDELSTGPGGGEENGGLSAPRSLDRFAVEVRASGSFRPGQPVQITVNARANLRTSDAEVRLVLPEVAAAREQGWRKMEMEPGRAFTPELSTRQSMSRGQSLTRTANVVIDQPGYYQVVATVVQRSDRDVDERPSGGEAVQEVAHDVVWLWIAESGGRATDDFLPGLFPAGTHAVPGPLTAATQPRPGAGDETINGPRGSRSPAGLRRSHTGYAGYVDSHAVYFNQDAGTTTPIPNAAYEYLIYNSAGAYVETRRGITNAEGLSYTACYQDAGGYGTYRMRILLDNERVTMAVPLAVEVSGSFSSDCGLAFTDQAPDANDAKKRSHVYTQLDRAIRASDALFGLQRTDITVRLDPNAAYSTYDWNGTDNLIIDTQPNTGYGDQVWGPYGAYVQAHEYGHAFHERALGGVKRYYSGACPSPHDVWRQTTHACAIAEGFPDYFAVATLGSTTGYWLTDIERGRYSPSPTNEWGFRAGANGSIIEGAFASFLYDLTDPANETHDQTQYPGRYVADIIRTCEVYSGGVWRLNTGSDHVVYCFLGTITDTALFGRSPAPTSMREGATEPEAYETRYFKIRKNYQKNLFGYDV